MKILIAFLFTLFVCANSQNNTFIYSTNYIINTTTYDGWWCNTQIQNNTNLTLQFMIPEDDTKCYNYNGYVNGMPFNSLTIRYRENKSCVYFYTNFSCNNSVFMDCLDYNDIERAVLMLNIGTYLNANYIAYIMACNCGNDSRFCK
jgi:hypothetical protein